MRILSDISPLAFNTLLAGTTAAQELPRPADTQNAIYVPAEPMRRFAPSYPIT